MTREKDFEQFTKLLIGIGKASPQGEPDPEKIEAYFQLLEDMDFETLRQNTIRAVREKGWFPMISDIRRTDEKNELMELEAQKAWDILERAFDYYFPGFGCSLDIVLRKLDEWNRPDLKDYVRSFGLEIVNQTNLPATRAQFLKSFKARKAEKHLELESCDENAKLSPRIAGMLEEIGR